MSETYVGQDGRREELAEWQADVGHNEYVERHHKERRAAEVSAFIDETEGPMSPFKLIERFGGDVEALQVEGDGVYPETEEGERILMDVNTLMNDGLHWVEDDEQVDLERLVTMGDPERYNIPEPEQAAAIVELWEVAIEYHIQTQEAAPSDDELDPDEVWQLRPQQ